MARTLPRLLSYLRPYTGRLASAITCMALYAAASGVTIGLFSPFVQILFAPSSTAILTASHTPAVSATPSGAKAPDDAARAMLPSAKWGSLERWPAVLRKPLEGFLFGRPPLAALGRMCALLLAAFLLKNIFDYLQSFLMASIEQGESHFREFKTALSGRPGEKVPRDPGLIRKDIAEALVAFANADGGELFVGIEDDGQVNAVLRDGLAVHENVVHVDAH